MSTAEAATRYEKVVHAVAAGMAAVSAALAAVIMLMITYDVFLRQRGGGGVGGSSELAEVLLVGVAFLAFAHAEKAQAHVGTSLLTDRLPHRLRAWVRCIGLGLMVALFAWITWETGGAALDSFADREVRFGVRQTPLWPARIAVAVGFAALTLEVFATVLRTVRHARATA